MLCFTFDDTVTTYVFHMFVTLGTLLETLEDAITQIWNYCYSLLLKDAWLTFNNVGTWLLCVFDLILYYFMSYSSCTPLFMTLQMFLLVHQEWIKMVKFLYLHYQNDFPVYFL